MDYSSNDNVTGIISFDLVIMLNSILTLLRVLVLW